MRKFILLLLTCFFLPASAQKVTMDRIGDDGAHHVMTSSKRMKFGKGKYDFSLSYFQDQEVSGWCLIVSSFTYISESTEILLKLRNDSIIHLKCATVNTGSVKEASYGIPLGYGVTYNTPETEKTYYSSGFAISQSDLDEIAYRGITKIRFSTGVDYIDKNIPNDSFGSFLTKSRKNIQKRIIHKAEKGNLYDGF